MNYKGILTEDTAVQFRKEGAVAVSISLINEGTVLRSLYVDLSDPDTMFCLAGRTPEAQEKMQRTFSSCIVEGKLWYPFNYIDLPVTAPVIEAKIKLIAGQLDIPPAYLEYGLFTLTVLNASRQVKLTPPDEAIIGVQKEDTL